MPRPRLLRLVTLTAVLAAAGCGGSERATRADDPGGAADETRSAQAEADTLGHELFRLADEVASYQASHRGRRIASIRQLGFDSLAPRVVRRLRQIGDTVRLEIAFRRPGTRRVLACGGTVQVLEDASLQGGAFPAECRTADGGVDTFTISPEPPASAGEKD